MMAIELIPSHSLFCLARIIKLFLTVLKIQANSLKLTTKSFSKFAGDTDTVMTYDTIRYEVGGT